MMSCPESIAFSIAGMTELSYPTMPGKRRSPLRIAAIRLPRISSRMLLDVYPEAVNCPSVRGSGTGAFAIKRTLHRQRYVGHAGEEKPGALFSPSIIAPGDVIVLPDDAVSRQSAVANAAYRSLPSARY